MKSYMKIALIWTAINIVLSPLVGWGLGKSDIHPIICVYLVMLFALSPGLLMIWNELIRPRSPQDNPEVRS